MALSKNQLEKILLEKNSEVKSYELLIDRNLIDNFNGGSATFKVELRDMPSTNVERDKVIEKYKNRGWNISCRYINGYTTEYTFI